MIESWLVAIRDHPDRPSQTQRHVLTMLALRLDWSTGQGFASTQQLVDDSDASKSTVLRATKWARAAGLLKEVQRGRRIADGRTRATTWALIPQGVTPGTVAPQGVSPDTLGSSPKVSGEPSQGVTRVPHQEPVLHLNPEKEGDAARRSAPGRHRKESEPAQRSKALTAAYAAAEPMCNPPAVKAIVLKAISAGRWADDEIRDALLRLAREGRGVTVETLRIELDGFPPSRNSLDAKIAALEALKDPEPDHTVIQGTVESDQFALRPGTGRAGQWVAAGQEFQNTIARRSTTDERVAQAQALKDVFRKRSHQPFRNPVNQDDYDGELRADPETSNGRGRGYQPFRNPTDPDTYDGELRA